MPTNSTHPLLLLRLRRGLSQSELARRVGVTVLTIGKIERGATRNPSPHLIAALGAALDVTGETLMRRIDAWFASLRPEDSLSLRAQAILRQSPDSLERDFGSFAAWRRSLTKTTILFANLIGVTVSTVTSYEAGVRHAGMSTHYRKALLRLNISDSYLNALERLPPRTDADNRTTRKDAS